MIWTDRGQRSADREAFYARIDNRNLAPLWEVLHGLVPPTPNTACAPAFWKYDEIRPLLIEAGDLISAAEAERRVLVLENPAHRGESRITNSLYGGLQMIKSGELARSHRHSQSALRFVLEGEGAFTTVNGEKTYMERGDLILTPAWAWHDHGCEARNPTIWFDGLDIPILQYFAAGFAEGANFEAQQVERPIGDALYRYGCNLLPADFVSNGQTSPVFAYPYARSRDALEHLKRAESFDPIHGLKMRYINPATGGEAMATISAFLQLLPNGFEGRPYRATEASVYIVAEGHGHTELEGAAYVWGPNDIFVIPNWVKHRHVASSEAVLFSCSDRGIHQNLGFWREDRSPA